jgi:hypothetical protein
MLVLRYHYSLTYDPFCYVHTVYMRVNIFALTIARMANEAFDLTMNHSDDFVKHCKC